MPTDSNPARPISRRQLGRASAILGITAALPARAAAQQRFVLESVAEQAADRAATISTDKKLSLLLPTGSEDNLRPVVAAFEARSGIKVSQQYTPVDDISTFLLLTRSGSGDTFDLALPPTFAIADLAEAGALEPLNDFAERYEPVDYRDDMLYRSGEQVDGHFYGYQTDGDVYLGFINEGLLRLGERHKAFADQHGRPPEQINHWADLDQLMAFYQRPSEGYYGGSLFRTPAYGLWEFWLRMHAAGVAPFDADMQPQLTAEPAVTALAAMVSATNSQEPTASVNSLFENWNSFKQGNKLINIGWGGSQKAFHQPESPIRKTVRAFLPPGDQTAPEGLPYFNWGWNFAVPSGSTRAEVGYLFSLFACSPTISTIAVRQPNGYFDPYRKIHYADSEIQGTYSNAFLQTHSEAIDHCLPDCYIGGQADYFSILARYVSLAVRGKLTPQVALRTADRQWQEITARRGRQRQIRSWQSVWNDYPESVKQAIQVFG